MEFDYDVIVQEEELQDMYEDLALEEAELCAGLCGQAYAENNRKH